ILALAAVLVDDDFWVLVLLCFIQSWCNAWALTCQYPCHLPRDSLIQERKRRIGRTQGKIS
ncbi:MAG: hypothetical protein ABSF38_13240, partial [Verrucomicrobiota bacterium]